VVASAAHGSELAPEVQFLREYRDRTVASTFAGAQFMRVFNNFYYSFSPDVARHVRASPYAAAAARVLMYPLLFSLRASISVLPLLEADPETGLTLAGIVASFLIGVTYLTPAIVALDIAKKRLQR